MKKLIIIILLLSLTGCSSVNLGAVKNNESKEKVNTEKLKAHKSKILKSETIKECIEYEELKSSKKASTSSNNLSIKGKCKKTRDIKKYYYISDKKVPVKKIKQKGKELTEDISKRTKNSVHFKIEKDEKLLGAADNSKETYIAHFYPGTQFISEDDEWYQTEVSTTSIETFKIETATTTSGIISYFLYKLIKIANAITDTFYPSTCGTIRHNGSPYSTIQSASTGTSLDPGAGTNIDYITNYKVGSTYYVDRTLYNIDTSEIGSGSTISSAKFYIKTSDVSSFRFNDDIDSVSLVLNTTASNTSYTIDDFGNFGTVKQATDIAFSTLFQNTYFNFDLNSTGLGNISKTGFTKLGTRCAKDIAADEPSGANQLGTQDAESAGTLNDPYLEVTYTTGPPTERRIMLIN
jgi:hypothetical protein